MFKIAISSIVVVSGIWLAGPVNAASLDLGFVIGSETNLGASYSPDTNLTISARGNVDPGDDLNPDALGLQPDSSDNTIVLSNKGMGVQEPNGHSGSAGISGKGHEENEEVIFDFGLSMWASSMVLGLADMDFGLKHGEVKTQPLLYLFLGRDVGRQDGFGNEIDYLVFDTEDIASEFEFTGGDASTLTGTLAFGDLVPHLDVFGLALFANDLVSSFTLRNSAGEIYITSYNVRVIAILEKGNP